MNVKPQISPLASAPPGRATDALELLFQERDPAFFDRLRQLTQQAETFEQALALSTWRKRARKQGFAPAGKASPLRLAILGGCSLYPLHELVQHYLEAAGSPRGLVVELFLGSYDNYIAEIMEETSGLYAFEPEVVLLLPSDRRCRYRGGLLDPRAAQEAAARQVAQDLLSLSAQLHERSRAEVVMTNFMLPARFDPGPFRGRTMASDWSFRKLVNLEIGLSAPRYVHVCDVEFLGSRRGTRSSIDARAWFESKQLYAADFLIDVAREVNHLVGSLRGSTKKLVALDLDNTLWGGVIGDDGIDGIEIGDTSPRGEAFKAFQQHLRSLADRGVLLAVVSKNDHDKAIAPFQKHPDMVLRLEDFVAFKANWEPKSDNLRQIAAELHLGMDSFVFVDDNPAEVEIVRQFAPEVEAVLLGPDPSEYVALLQDARFFEPLDVTPEDTRRVQQYQQEAQRQELLSSSTDLGAYLRSLEMKGTLSELLPVDVPRISQLINKSNQFNLTTRRRTESEVVALLTDPSYAAFSVRLADKFSDHGLISVVIGLVVDGVLLLDTWLMSCRVLKRQVEDEVLNEIVRLARLRGCRVLRGVYVPSGKNGMVQDLYPRLGFTPCREHDGQLAFELDLATYEPRPTEIHLLRRSHEPY